MLDAKEIEKQLMVVVVGGFFEQMQIYDDLLFLFVGSGRIFQNLTPKNFIVCCVVLWLQYDKCSLFLFLVPIK